VWHALSSMTLHKDRYLAHFGGWVTKCNWIFAVVGKVQSSKCY